MCNFAFQLAIRWGCKFFTLTVCIFLFCCALFAEVRRRFNGCLLVDVHWVLCAIRAPMPLVILAPSNVFHHSHYLGHVSCFTTCEVFRCGACLQEMFFHFCPSVSAILSINKHYRLSVRQRNNWHASLSPLNSTGSLSLERANVKQAPSLSNIANQKNIAQATAFMHKYLLTYTGAPIWFWLWEETDSQR